MWLKTILSVDQVDQLHKFLEIWDLMEKTTGLIVFLDMMVDLAVHFNPWAIN